MNRRHFVASSAAAMMITTIAAQAAASTRRTLPAGDNSAQPAKPPTPQRRLKHSVCRWCYGGMKLEDLCDKAKAIGVSSVELLTEKEWPIALSRGLQCAVAMGPTQIGKGFNRVENHDEFIKEGERLLPLIKQAGIPTMIVFSGNRAGMSDDEGLKNCAIGLKRLMPAAEAAGVTVIMELLNSRIDHKDYMCDRTAWGVELVRRVGSDRFRLLYDIYHMQIMEGDVIRTITDNMPHIAHFHTGGVPGRHEIDERQELNYRRIASAIADAGYTGYLGQEFIPTGDPIAELKKAVEICTV